MLKECGQQLFCSLAVAANNMTSDVWLSLTSYFCKSKKAKVFHHMKDPKIRTPKEATEATEAPCGNPRPGASHCEPRDQRSPSPKPRRRQFRRSHPSAHPYKSQLLKAQSTRKAQGRQEFDIDRFDRSIDMVWHSQYVQYVSVCHSTGKCPKCVTYEICSKHVPNMFHTCSKHVPNMFQTCSKHVKYSLQGQLWVWRCQSVDFFAFCLACKICNSNIYLCTAHLSRWRHVRTSIQRCSRWFPNGIKWFTCRFLCKISWSKNHYEGGLKTQCSKCSKILGWTELKPVSCLSCQGQGHHPMGMATLGSSDGPIYFLRRTHFEGRTTYASPSPCTHLFPLQHESGGPVNRTCWALVSVQRFQSDTCHLLQFILINDH